MKYEDIRYMATINETDTQRVNDLADSMIANGWRGCPILVYAEQLLTGSHRLAALAEVNRRWEDGEIETMPAVLDEDIAEDVTEIVEAAIAAREEEDGWAPDIDYQDIGWLLAGSWVEEYKDQIVEW